MRKRGMIFNLDEYRNSTMLYSNCLVAGNIINHALNTTFFVIKFCPKSKVNKILKSDSKLIL